MRFCSVLDSDRANTYQVIGKVNHSLRYSESTSEIDDTSTHPALPLPNTRAFPKYSEPHWQQRWWTWSEFLHPRTNVSHHSSLLSQAY